MKTYKIFSALFFLILLIPSHWVFAQGGNIYNPGFEQISITTRGDTFPTGWAFSGNGMGVSSKIKQSGIYSLSLWNWYDYLEGSTVNSGGPGNFSSSNALREGAPVRERPLMLSGFYAYDTTGAIGGPNNALAIVLLKKWNPARQAPDTVGMGITKLSGTSMKESMKKFVVYIDEWVSNVTPDSAVVIFKSSEGSMCGGSDCMFLYVDDIRLIYAGSKQAGDPDKPENIQGTYVHGPPSLLKFKFASTHSDYNARLTDASGKLIQSWKALNNFPELECPDLKSGHYHLELSNGGKIWGIGSFTVTSH